MSYELVLAQSITILYGSTILNYTLIIGIYIFSLGIGAALHARFSTGAGLRSFWKIELLLSVAGGLAPFMILSTEILVGKAAYDLVTPAAALISAGIGILSGMEIPVLIEIASKDRNIQATDSHTVRNIIGLDFIGTFVAAALVPLICFPFIGVIRTAVLTAFINGLLALALLVKFRKEADTRAIGLSCGTLVFLTLLAFYTSDLSRHLFKEVF